MPELPEVEHVVRALRNTIIGRRIVNAELRLKRTAPGISKTTFDRKLRGARIQSVGRRGKHILFYLDNKNVLLVHLRMTGKFVYLNPDDKLLPYSHVVFHFDNEHRLVFCDMRQFGRMSIGPVDRFLMRAPLRDLAPEPLSDEFSLEYLRNTLARSKREIKLVLLDQTRVLGLGNIYASEALFLARINPRRIAQTLSRKKIECLHLAVKQILDEAIESGSTLRIDLADGGSSYFGSSERFWRVYEREGEPCVNCGVRIKRIVQGGRSTYYCARCQR